MKTHRTAARVETARRISALQACSTPPDLAIKDLRLEQNKAIVRHSARAGASWPARGRVQRERAAAVNALLIESLRGL